MPKIRSTLLMVLMACLPLLTAAKAKEVKAPLSAQDILKQAEDKAAFGLSQGKAKIEMTIEKSAGSKKSRTLQLKMRRTEQGLIQYLIQFTQPRQIRGTSFLVHQREKQLPQQWIYLPVTKKPKKVAAGKAKASFFGTDFLFADLLPYSGSEKDVQLTRLKDEGSRYVVQVVPLIKESPYKKIVIYIEKNGLRPARVLYFDQGAKPFKELSVRETGAKSNKEVFLTMKNLKKGSQTTLRIFDMDEKAVLKASEFTVLAMQRI